MLTLNEDDRSSYGIAVSIQVCKVQGVRGTARVLLKRDRGKERPM